MALILIIILFIIIRMYLLTNVITNDQWRSQKNLTVRAQVKTKCRRTKSAAKNSSGASLLLSNSFLIDL